MPISGFDQYYRQEEVTPSLDVLGWILRQAYGQPPDAYGTKGNLSHSSGYHRSRRWILNSPDSSNGSSDYSVAKPRDKNGDPDWVSAFDFTPGVWGTADNRAKMKLLTSRLLAAAQAGDPRLANVREFAGTVNGSSVITYDLNAHAFKSPFDNSHLDHVHVSIWRDASDADHTGIANVITGGIMPLTNEQITDQYVWTAGITGVGLDANGKRPDDRFHAVSPYYLIQKMQADLAAIKTSEATSLAAINSVLQMVQAGGGSIDAAPILAAIDAAKDAAHADVTELQAENNALRAQIAAFRTAEAKAAQDAASDLAG